MLSSVSPLSSKGHKITQTVWIRRSPQKYQHCFHTICHSAVHTLLNIRDLLVSPPDETLPRSERKMKVVQYCAKVMQAKSTNFVFCSPDVSSKVRTKIRALIRGAWNDNSLEQSAIFRRLFVTKTNIRNQ